MESIHKLSNAKGQGKESLRRINVLNKLFMKYITDLMATDLFAKEIIGYGLQVGGAIVQTLSLFSIYKFFLFLGHRR